MNAIPADRQQTQSWIFQTKTYIPSAATITLLAGGALSSATLLYYQPQKWLLTTASVCLLSACTIPNILRYGNTGMVKTAITVSLAALGSLALGASLIASSTMGQALIISFQMHSLPAILFSSFLFTGLIGYTIPYSNHILQKAYSIINDSYWQARFDYLSQEFNNLPEIGQSFWKENILPYICLYTALITPNQVQNLLNWNTIESNPHLQAVIHSFPPLESNKLNLFLRFFGHLPVIQQSIQDEEARTEAITIALNRLKHILDYLSAEELDAEIDLLLKQSRQLVPDLLLEEEFLSLFQGSAAKIMNAKMDDFLNLMAHLSQQQAIYDQLIAESKALKMAIEESGTIHKEVHSQQLLKLDQRYKRLRSEIEHVRQQKHNWKNFLQILRRRNLAFSNHFTRLEELEQLLQNRSIMESFEKICLSLYGFNPQEEVSLIDYIQHLTHLLNENASLDTQPFSEANPYGLTASAISQKVCHVMYRSIAMSLFLVPFFTYPIASGIGFGCGMVYFSLKKFRGNFQNTAVEALGNAFFREGMVQTAINFARQRHFFSLSSQSRENMATFTHSHFFARMRIINFEILATIAITYSLDYIPDDIHPPTIRGLGGFIQGTTLAKEVVSFF